MITGNAFSTVDLTENAIELTAMLNRENVVEVEIPVKGLLVKESVAICNCLPDQVEFQTSNISHFCTGSFNYPLFIKLSKTNKALSCRLSDLLVYSGKLVANDFRLLDQDWIDRQYDRVQPKLPLFVSVINGKKKIKANLFDLSMTGMCILLDSSLISRRKVEVGSKLQVMTRFPGNEKLCTITGKIIQIKSVSEHLQRIGMNIALSKNEVQVVAHYLSSRKREILDELFLNFMELLHYREVKDEYF